MIQPSILRLTGCIVLALFPLVSMASSLDVYPRMIELTNPEAFQKVLVYETSGQRSIADRSDDVVARIENPDVAVVEDGVIRPRGNGKTTVEFSVDDSRVEATIQVTGFTDPFEWSFIHDVQPSLTRIGCNTGACHGSASGKNGFKLSLRGYENNSDYNSITRQAKGRRILIAAPGESLLLQKPVGEVPHAGGRLIRKDSLEYRVIHEWIANRATPPREDEKALEYISVTPRNLRLVPGDRHQLLVTAYYDDGSSRDVTHWSKFDTTNDGVAEISPNGLADIKRSGSAALTVWYSGKVTFASLEVPYPADSLTPLFAEASRTNFIDDAILGQLQSLNIPPSGTSTDAEFVRRAYLDAIGVLPTREELLAFVLGSSPDKREALVDSLLQREEFNDYWAYKWSDLLLVSTRNPGLNTREAALAYYRFIRESVEQNLGWDEFVRRIITAEGSTLQNGAANFFVLHKETTALVETTSVAFMGLSINCAKCHNHPMEKWTQDDYFGMASLMSRVRLKNGDRSGETFVHTGASGDIIHPVYGRPMPPKPLDGEPMGLNEDGRREYLAEWLTAPENPYFARSVINRVWKHFMGVGLVEPVDDLRLTNPPTNEALFAALEADFIEHDFDIRHLIRTIMTSAAYQRSSQPLPQNESDLTHFSRYYPKRLPAEVMLDAYSSITGIPTTFSGYPEGWRALQLPDSAAVSSFLDTFGRPERKQTCACERDSTPTLSQALHISNGATLNEKLQEEGNRIDAFLESDATVADYIHELYMDSLCRVPTQDEYTDLHEAIVPAEGWEQLPPEDKRLALEDLTWAVLSGKEFMFTH